jgi:hypothetical protein
VQSQQEQAIDDMRKALQHAYRPYSLQNGARFGSIKRWFGKLEAPIVGMVKTHAQHVPKAIIYNVYRLPEIYSAQTVVEIQKIRPKERTPPPQQGGIVSRLNT